MNQVLGCRTDRYCEQAAVAQLLTDLQQQVMLVADASVGDEDDLSQVVSGGGRSHCGVQGGAHVGAPIGLEIEYVTGRDFQFGGRGHHRLTKQLLMVGIELDDVEQVIRPEESQGMQQGGTCLVDRCTFHGPRGVDHENQLPGLWRHFLLQGWGQHQKGVHGLAVLPRGQRGLWCSAQFGDPGQLEYPIGPCQVLGQEDVIAIRRRMNVDIMIAAVDPGKWQAGLQTDTNIQLMC